jgi:hypothetical protein
MSLALTRILYLGDRIMPQNAPDQPKAVAVWLIDNTMLTFDQIAEFCHLHPLEVQTIANGDGTHMQGQSPLNTGELTKDEIARCEKDTNAKLQIVTNELFNKIQGRSKGPRYTPVSKRGDKPDAIAWLLKHHPEVADSQIVKLIGTTKNTINNIRNKTHANMINIKARSPIELGLCKYEELDAAVQKARKKLEKEGKELPQSQAQIEEEYNREPEQPKGGFDFSNFLGTGSDDR